MARWSVSRAFQRPGLVGPWFQAWKPLSRLQPHWGCAGAGTPALPPYHQQWARPPALRPWEGAHSPLRCLRSGAEVALDVGRGQAKAGSTALPPAIWHWCRPFKMTRRRSPQKQPPISHLTFSLVPGPEGTPRAQGGCSSLHVPCPRLGRDGLPTPLPPPHDNYPCPHLCLEQPLQGWEGELWSSLKEKVHIRTTL